MKLINFDDIAYKKLIEEFEDEVDNYTSYSRDELDFVYSRFNDLRDLVDNALLIDEVLPH